MWRGEAEPVAQRAGEQAGPGGRADQRERRQVERDRGRARALADDDVDPEVLHRHVEQFLSRPGDAVDLVDEQHLALGEAGEQRGQVAGALDRRAAGHPDRRAELGRDDHREAGLAQPGRPGQQHVVRRPARGAARSRAPAAAARAPWAGPTNSASCLGRRLASTSRSSGSPAPRRARSAHPATLDGRAAVRLAHRGTTRAAGCCGAAAAGHVRVVAGSVSGDHLDRVGHLLAGEAQPGQRVRS